MTNENECKGTYSVSGYTRNDGTEVSGYTRTCGAAHNSSSRTSDLASKTKFDEQEKFRRRADILYGNDTEYIKKYYGKNRERDILKWYREKSLEDYTKNIREKENRIALIESHNYHFSDEEIIKARKFIQGEEQFRSQAYKPTTNDVWTIGYGHTGKVDGKPITKGMKITIEKAEELYRKDFEAHIRPLKEIPVELTSNQKIALASFSFNLGPETLRKSQIISKIREHDFLGAANEFDKYVKQKNKKTGVKEILPGLVNRRKREKELFLLPDEE